MGDAEKQEADRFHAPVFMSCAIPDAGETVQPLCNAQTGHGSFSPVRIVCEKANLSRALGRLFSSTRRPLGLEVRIVAYIEPIRLLAPQSKLSVPRL